MSKRFDGYIWVGVAGVAALAVIAIVADRYISTFSTHVIADQEKWGQFGDYFGGVLNPILSFFAFVTLLMTLREQIKSSQDADERHDEQVREQRLFQLIGIALQNSASTRYISDYHVDESLNRVLEGRIALQSAWKDLASYRLGQVSELEILPLDRYLQVKRQFDLWKKTAWPSVGSFIESVFLVLEFISRSGNSKDPFVVFAMGVLRSQLSESERLLLWYTAICSKNNPVFGLLLDSFIFKNTESAVVSDPQGKWRDDLLACAFVSSNIEKNDSNGTTA